MQPVDGSLAEKFVVLSQSKTYLLYLQDIISNFNAQFVQFLASITRRLVRNFKLLQKVLLCLLSR